MKVECKILYLVIMVEILYLVIMPRVEVQEFSLLKKVAMDLQELDEEFKSGLGFCENFSCL
jgi:hypothetical protein